MNPSQQHVFLTGGTGYIGRRLIPSLLAHGHRITALVRPESKNKLPAGCEVVWGNALDANLYRDHVRPATTFVQLVGVSHPSPAKAAESVALIWLLGKKRWRLQFMQAFSISST